MKIDQWTRFLMSVGGDPSAEAIVRSGDARQIIDLAKSKGFEFTEMDIDDVHASGGLSDTTLDTVAGGHPEAML